MGMCGACTVLMDNVAIFSCLTPIAALSNRQITTLEGLGSIEDPCPLQRSFIAEQAAQCGYCTSGMIMRAQSLLLRDPTPSDTQIRAAMEPNLCRCGTHMRILRAISKVAHDAATKKATEGHS